VTQPAAVLPDVLAHDLDIVFCGTAAGTVSARQRAYYAGPGNAFWPTLHAVGLTPVLLRAHDYARLSLWSMGVTDLAKHVSGSDDSLRKHHFDRERIHEVIEEYRPRIVAFTSKRAASEFTGHPVGYGLLAGVAGASRLFVLPSPSGAARRHWDPEFWRELARLRSRLIEAGRKSALAGSIAAPCACSSAG
jgi:double-stranded uracil-DNA glycosylase